MSAKKNLPKLSSCTPWHAAVDAMKSPQTQRDAAEAARQREICSRRSKMELGASKCFVV